MISSSTLIINEILRQFLVQLKSNIVFIILTILFVCYFNAKMTKMLEKVYIIDALNKRIGLSIELIKKQLPEHLINIVLTPSQASKTKEAKLQSLLNILRLKYPIVLHCAPKPSNRHFSTFKFSWTWDNQPESNVYKPFIEAVQQTLLKLKLEIHDVSKGQNLWEDQFLYTTNISSLRTLDEHGRKTGPVHYKGQIRGRTDLVVVDNRGPWAYILSHNVRFVIEVKLPMKSQSELSSAVRDATIQLLGLCCDNYYRTPPVLLTDFSNVFIVFSIRRSSRFPLKFDIDATRFPDICTALSSAYDLCIKLGVSVELGRSNTPDGSVEGFD
jgi:hypothetical protein